METDNDIDFCGDKLINHAWDDIKLGDAFYIASHLAAMVPELYKLNKRMQSPRMLANASKAHVIADLIMHRAFFNEWKETDEETMWQLALRLQYACDTLEELKEIPEVNDQWTYVMEACAGIATLAAYTYDKNAALWVGRKTTADDVLKHDDLYILWPHWPNDDERLGKLDERYSNMIHAAKFSKD